MAQPHAILSVAGKVRIQGGRAVLDLPLDAFIGAPEPGAAGGTAAGSAPGQDGPPKPSDIVARIRDGTLATAPSKVNLTPRQIASYISSVQRTLNLSTGLDGGWSSAAQDRFDAWLLAEKRIRQASAPPPMQLALPAPPHGELLALPAPPLPSPPARADNDGENSSDENSSDDSRSDNSSSESSSESGDAPKDRDDETHDVDVRGADDAAASDSQEKVSIKAESESKMQEKAEDEYEKDEKDQDEVDNDILLMDLNPSEIVDELGTCLNDAPDQPHHHHMVRLLRF